MESPKQAEQLLVHCDTQKYSIFRWCLPHQALNLSKGRSPQLISSPRTLQSKTLHRQREALDPYFWLSLILPTHLGLITYPTLSGFSLA